MPYKKTYRKKRYNRRRRRPAGRQPYVPRAINLRRGEGSPFPFAVRTKHRYVQTISMNPATGAEALHNFRANGMTDPDLTSGGHQPMGFDQFIINYDHYMIEAAKITIIGMPISDVVSTANLTFGVSLRDATVPAILFSDRMEQSRTKWIDMGTGDGPGGPKTISMWYIGNKFFNKNVLNEDNQKGSSTSDPAEDAIFQVWARSFDDDDDVATFNLRVIITYYAVWNEPKNLVGS